MQRNKQHLLLNYICDNSHIKAISNNSIKNVTIDRIRINGYRDESSDILQTTDQISYNFERNTWV